jgi:hypothetical protein
MPALAGDPRAQTQRKIMNAKKQRDKNRRRASKLARQAWDAADDMRLDLAVKIIGRAVELNPSNPVLWHDQATLLVQLHEDEKAARSFESAIQAAPEFAEAYSGLAAIRVRQGKPQQAVTLQREAVRLAPQLDRHKAALIAYEVLLAGGCGSDARADSETQAPLGESRFEQAPSDAWSELAARIERLNWHEIDAHLTARGLAHVPRLLCAEKCETLRSMFEHDRLFAKTVTMNKSRFGRGVYRYFAAPLPSLVDAIRRLFYPYLAEIANRWQVQLTRGEPYPATWPEFNGRCIAAGQTTASPLLLRYEAGGFNALHQDIRGEVFFPVQLVVVLSPRADSIASEGSAFTGGEFLFCDQPERKASERRAVPAGLGDAVLFCTRERLVRVGGVFGLKPVKHGLSEIESGTRYAIGIPFHEFA